MRGICVPPRVYSKGCQLHPLTFRPIEMKEMKEILQRVLEVCIPEGVERENDIEVLNSTSLNERSMVGSGRGSCKLS